MPQFSSEFKGPTLRIRRGHRCSNCTPARLNNDMAFSLFSLKREPLLVAEARSMLASLEMQVRYWDDKKVFKSVETMLASGRLHVCGERSWYWATGGGGVTEGREAPPREPEPRPIPAARTALPERATFAAGHMPGIQAKGLENASEDGAPVCEICRHAMEVT